MKKLLGKSIEEKIKIISKDLHDSQMENDLELIEIFIKNIKMSPKIPLRAMIFKFSKEQILTKEEMEFKKKCFARDRVYK